MFCYLHLIKTICKCSCFACFPGISLHVSNAAPKYEHNRNSFQHSNVIGRNQYNSNSNDKHQGGLFKKTSGANKNGNNYFSAPMNSDGGNGVPVGHSASGGGPPNRENTYARGTRGNYMLGQQGTSNSSSSYNNAQSRPLDLPNIHTLGINPQGPNSTQNPLGLGLNLNSLPVNTALLAAALNQFGFLGGQLQNQDQV